MGRLAVPRIAALHDLDEALLARKGRAVAVAFDATLTHRFGFEIRGLAEATSNASYTVRPSDGATTGLFSREIVSNDVCNKCHNKLDLHGDARFDAPYCVTCHNPGSVDQDTGNTVDMTVMIHKIHAGANLPSVIGGTPYEIYGFRERQHDYSAVLFPQDLRNCRTCHDETDPDTPDAGNWLTVPTAQACGACHDDVDFETGVGHSDANLAVNSNADCALCHSEGGFVGGVDVSHEIPEQIAAQDFQFNIVSVENGGPGLMPSVTFSVTNPNDNDTPYDIANDEAFVQGGGASRLAIDLGWSTTDYTNEGSGSGNPGFRPGSPAQMVSINPLFGGAVDNMDGTFTVTSSVAIPADAVGTGLVAIEGHPALDVNDDGTPERLPAGGATDFFPITDATAQPRREAVSLGACLDCHQQLSIHGNNRTDNIDLCLGCHNADATDIRARTEAGVDAATSVDGKDEESVDFKRMIHAIHAGGVRADGFAVYGFGGSLHDYSEVVFPGNLNVCENCHVEEGYRPVGPEVLATTIDSGADLNDPTDDLNITANTAVCSACHDSTLAVEHMKQNGGAFDAMQAADGTLTSPTLGTVTETCALCHGEGGIADVVESHSGE